jgi:hypothetical protein
MFLTTGLDYQEHQLGHTGCFRGKSKENRDVTR